MIAAIKPKVVNQHRVPISKSALTPIVYPRFVLGRFSYLHKTAGLVNTWITRGQNCHSRPSTKAGHDAAEGAVLPGIVAFSEGVAHTPSRLPETSRASWSGYFLLARLPDLRGKLAGDCPHSSAVSVHERCGVNYPQLAAVLGSER